uniref:Vav guanine nucleotide exchange factor 3 n=1 Tax=Denticeps clupeoides TaxID=299321 RepID=A0AAY4D8D3_9TELE
MEYWKQCAAWLISCKVLPPSHRVTWESAQVFDLAQTLRDGVLLCQLLNNLRAQSINLKEINLRPQMSQFLCLKNIRTFLSVCMEIFGMKKNELFEAFDLFDVRDFGKVRRFSFIMISSDVLRMKPSDLLKRVALPFPTGESVQDEEIYNHLEDLIDVEDEEDLYDCVYDDGEGEEVYEDLMKAESVPPPKQTETDIRSCCLMEIKQTEEKYTETLDSIEKFFLNPLKKFLSPAEIETVFVNIPDLVKVHKGLVDEVKNSVGPKTAPNLYKVFLNYKERLLIYGKYCSHVEKAISVLDDICKEKEDVRLKLEECSKRANNGKFTLRDLLVVPMQRVLKYHLLLQELVRHTLDPTEKKNLRLALDAMKDLAQYVNEVKRDNETLRDIDQYQKSIENLNQSLRNYGRPKGDGEVRVATVDKRAKQDRHIFLFDAAVIVCKRRGDNYEMKEVIDLHLFKITDNPTSDKESRKWSHGFYLTHNQGQTGFEFFFKTKELKKKWLEQFGMALSNIHPENGNSNCHEFRMHTFERITSCSSCHMLLRGIFNQGYLCCKCGAGAHKECLGRLRSCGKAGEEYSGTAERELCLPKMQVVRNYNGLPPPSSGPALHIQAGDIIELMCADLHSSWWKGKILTKREVGFFPSDAVKPCPCVSISSCLFAGPMERHQAETELLNRVNSTYLVRHRSREFTEYAISINGDGCWVCCCLRVHVCTSLTARVLSLDTTLQFPYREPENAVMGVAIARYDFSSRDTRELSLQEGDVVKIYTKSGANGWWRGEVNGRVGVGWVGLTFCTV